MEVGEIESKLGARPGIPLCGVVAVIFLMCLLLNTVIMGRGPRMKADAAK